MRIMMAPVPESAQLSFGRPARSWPGSVAARSRKTFRPPGHPWLLLAAGLVLLHLGQPLGPGADTCRPCGSLRPVSVSPWPPGWGLCALAADRRRRLACRASGLRDRPGPVHGIAAADAGPRRLERPARMCGGLGGLVVLPSSGQGQSGPRRSPGPPRCSSSSCPDWSPACSPRCNCAGTLWLTGPVEGSLWCWVEAFWMSRCSGGILALTPPLLAVLTPWLIRHGQAAAEPRGQVQAAQRGVILAGRLTWGDCVEITGLVLGTGLFGLLLARGCQPCASPGGLAALGPAPAGHRLGQPRRRARGGTVVAGAAVGLTLIRFGFFHPTYDANAFWQANLLAQCSTALLVAARANWIRLSEARYRQVVSRIPVVLYSARVVPPAAEPAGRRWRS